MEGVGVRGCGGQCRLKQLCRREAVRSGAAVADQRGQATCGERNAVVQSLAERALGDV